MNKKILGFSLVSSTLVGSVSGVVSAENFYKQSHFTAPKNSQIPEKVVKAINDAVDKWNALCNFVEENASKFSKKEQNILQQVEDEKNTVLKLRKIADDLIKSEHCENKIENKPWDYSIAEREPFFSFPKSCFNPAERLYLEALVKDINTAVLLNNTLRDYLFKNGLKHKAKIGEYNKGNAEVVNTVNKYLKDRDFLRRYVGYCCPPERRKKLGIKILPWEYLYTGDDGDFSGLFNFENIKGCRNNKKTLGYEGYDEWVDGFVQPYEDFFAFESKRFPGEDEVYVYKDSETYKLGSDDKTFYLKMVKDLRYQFKDGHYKTSDKKVLAINFQALDCLKRRNEKLLRNEIEDVLLNDKQS